MDLKFGLLFIGLVAGCFALPNPASTDDAIEEGVRKFPYLDTRLVGAAPAPVASAPYMVALTTGTLIKSFFCGGSIITAYHVLTAAHCIVFAYSGTSLVSSLEGVVGTNVWNDQFGVAYSFARNFTHEHYVSATIKNDIGILETRDEIIFNLRTAPVPLDYDYIGGGVVSRVAGWGRIGQYQSASVVLLELHSQTLSGEECSRAVAEYANTWNIVSPPIEDHIEICTFHSDGYGNCNGDSGSALVTVRSRKQIGLVSWGFPCGRGVPDMYARVSGFKDWIENILSTRKQLLN